jgi:adenylyltransferase/sulfurtransferase
VLSCAEGGVLGVLPGLIGTIQATEIIKLILGKGEPLLNRLLLVDALQMKFREIKLRRDPDCPLCGTNPTIKTLIDYHQFCGLKNPVQAPQLGPDEVSIHDMKRALENPGLGIMVIDVREPDEHRLAHIPGAQLVPLSTLACRFGELNPSQPTYVHCKSGVRSLRAVHFLRNQGFKDVKSVQGGIMAWLEQKNAQ